MLKTSHIIQKQTIEVSFENLDNAIGVQNQIGDMFYEKLHPQMRALFDDMFGENDYASLDKIEIDCGLLNQKNWEQEFIEQAIRKLKEELLQVNKKKPGEAKAEDKIAKETFFFFLVKGFLPWNKRIHNVAELEQHVQLNKNLISELKNLIVQHKNVAERLVYQFSKTFVENVLVAIFNDKKSELKEMNSLLERMPFFTLDKRILNTAILKAFATNEGINSKQLFLSFLLTKTIDNTELQSSITEELKKNGFEKNDLAMEDKQQANSIKDNDKQASDTMYISNAGLVLLHPFLQVLFEQVMLIKENKWIDETSQQKAVAVLQFLAMGNDKFEECDVTLNKVLCGIEIDEALITEPEIDAKTKKECEVLLKNVITYWSILKNTSIDGLRETFLQRNGKLSKVDNGWLLQVEQKAVDILLSHLPWGIGVIKLTWMNDMLYVEWA